MALRNWKNQCQAPIALGAVFLQTCRDFRVDD